MKARRAGVSTIWAMFSRVTSKTSGSSCSSRNRSTSVHEGQLLGRELEVHGWVPSTRRLPRSRPVAHRTRGRI